MLALDFRKRMHAPVPWVVLWKFGPLHTQAQTSHLVCPSILA
jgi:hypothetical protein